MNATRILAVRHGETLWNRETRIQGFTDIGLSELGQWQAQQLALALRDESLAACYASDLRRARDTAQAVANVHGHTVHTDPGLRERCFGQFEGHTWTEIEAQWPEASQAWRQRLPDWQPQGGESLLHLQARVLNALNSIAQRHMGEQILVVVHGGVLDILYRAATHLELQTPRAWELRNTAINRLLWSPEGLSLIGWDDRAHLESDTLDERSA